MSQSKFTGWFSDVGFTVRVLIIADMLGEFAVSWGSHWNSPYVNAISEIRETALLEMERWEELGRAAGYLMAEGRPEDDNPPDKSAKVAPD